MSNSANDMLQSLGNVGDVIGDIAGASPKVAEYLNSMAKVMNMGINNLATAAASLAENLPSQGVGTGQNSGAGVMV